MKKSCGILFAIMLLVTPSNAQQSLSVSMTLESYSSYILRGLKMTDKITLQPSIALGFGGSGLSIGAWGNISIQEREFNDYADMIDLYADYSRILSEESGVGISIGFHEYIFPKLVEGEESENSEEVYVGISLDNALSPALTFYYDSTVFDGWYLAFSAGIDVPLVSEGGPVLSLGGRVAMSNYSSKTGFNDVTATASLGFGVGSVSIVPTVGIAYFDSGEEDYFSGTNFYGGVGIGFSP